MTTVAALELSSVGRAVASRATVSPWYAVGSLPTKTRRGSAVAAFDGAATESIRAGTGSKKRVVALPSRSVVWAPPLVTFQPGPPAGATTSSIQVQPPPPSAV